MNATPEITDDQIRELRECAMFKVYSTHAGIARDARALVALCDRALGNTLDISVAFPTTKLTDSERAAGWELCRNEHCKPMMGEHRIIGSHAHPRLPRCRDARIRCAEIWTRQQTLQCTTPSTVTAKDL